MLRNAIEVGQGFGFGYGCRHRLRLLVLATALVSITAFFSYIRFRRLPGLLSLALASSLVSYLASGWDVASFSFQFSLASVLVELGLALALGEVLATGSRLVWVLALACEWPKSTPPWRVGGFSRQLVGAFYRRSANASKEACCEI